MDKLTDEALLNALTFGVDALKSQAESRAEELEQAAQTLRTEIRQLEDATRQKRNEAKELLDRAQQIRETTTPPPPYDKRDACRDEFHGSIRGSELPVSNHVRRQTCGCWSCHNCGRHKFCDAHDER